MFIYFYKQQSEEGFIDNIQYNILLTHSSIFFLLQPSNGQSEEYPKLL